MESLYNILDKPLIIEKHFKPQDSRAFKIRMDNLYLNSMGKVYKRQQLDSRFTRVINHVYQDAIAFVTNKWDTMSFTNKLPKKPDVSIDWTFMQKREFYSHMILSNERLEEIKAKNRNIVNSEDYKKCFDSIEKTFSGLPKLPSIYLAVMQTFDILAFDNYLSYIYVHSYTNKGWNLDQWVKITPPELEHTQDAKIGLGLYSDNSFFRNGNFYLKFTGYGKANNKFCAVFDYYCDYSQVKMQEKNASNIQRNGTSYYHGQLWVSLDSHDIERGTMLESYIALQEGSVKTPVHIRRRVLCESLA
ncbi:hypothetical protein [Ruminiclostridium papyrosolvens]|uniref:Uncharacterized protein n=1 Tax=Ruminiclostridium papyrosolvens C7 TaxID=1330534 RepID=U4QZU7_9FIRM|nr:hypothetical protein [Ruminiclostridium papyrosolvens]EPR10509.1 hypothetical protein L323_13015 [Ruminiclostridium papyrosolvens C7]